MFTTGQKHQKLYVFTLVCYDSYQLYLTIPQQQSILLLSRVEGSVSNTIILHSISLAK